jgi:hypothetical protein
VADLPTVQRLVQLAQRERAIRVVHDALHRVPGLSLNTLDQLAKPLRLPLQMHQLALLRWRDELRHGEEITIAHRFVHVNQIRSFPSSCSARGSTASQISDSQSGRWLNGGETPCPYMNTISSSSPLPVGQA